MRIRLIISNSATGFTVSRPGVDPQFKIIHKNYDYAYSWLSFTGGACFVFPSLSLSFTFGFAFDPGHKSS